MRISGRSGGAAERRAGGQLRTWLKPNTMRAHSRCHLRMADLSCCSSGFARSVCSSLTSFMRRSLASLPPGLQAILASSHSRCNAENIGK